MVWVVVVRRVRRFSGVEDEWCGWWWCGEFGGLVVWRVSGMKVSEVECGWCGGSSGRCIVKVVKVVSYFQLENTNHFFFITLYIHTCVYVTGQQ